MKLRQAALTALACAAGVYGIAFVDLTLRARSAYLEGEKYLEWNAHPELKKSYFDAKLAEQESRLNADYRAGRLSREELDQRLYAARFERDQRVAESSIKYAYIWFESGANLFSPPNSKWAVLSRQKMAETQKLWEQELAQGPI